MSLEERLVNGLALNWCVTRNLCSCFQCALVICRINVINHCSRTTTLRAALMGCMVVSGFSLARRKELCLFPSQSAAPMAGF